MTAVRTRRSSSPPPLPLPFPLSSLWDYTHVVMNFLNGKEGEQHGTPRDLEWLNLFDLVIVGR